ncbi:MAG TPA: hypothetical protein VE267_09670 [Bradyrhizobium sp.]|nr:hypothetical protein [Bradyrhizobium sp.]
MHALKQKKHSDYRGSHDKVRGQVGPGEDMVFHVPSLLFPLRAPFAPHAPHGKGSAVGTAPAAMSQKRASAQRRTGHPEHFLYKVADIH